MGLQICTCDFARLSLRNSSSCSPICVLFLGAKNFRSHVPDRSFMWFYLSDGVFTLLLVLVQLLLEVYLKRDEFLFHRTGSVAATTETSPSGTVTARWRGVSTALPRQLRPRGTNLIKMLLARPCW